MIHIRGAWCYRCRSRVSEKSTLAREDSFSWKIELRTKFESSIQYNRGDCWHTTIWDRLVSRQVGGNFYSEKGLNQCLKVVIQVEKRCSLQTKMRNVRIESSETINDFHRYSLPWISFEGPDPHLWSCDCDEWRILTENILVLEIAGVARSRFMKLNASKDWRKYDTPNLKSEEYVVCDWCTGGNRAVLQH